MATGTITRDCSQFIPAGNGYGELTARRSTQRSPLVCYRVINDQMLEANPPFAEPLTNQYLNNDSS